MLNTEVGALDVLVILVAALVVWCGGAWFGWEACAAKYRGEHVSRRG